MTQQEAARSRQRRWRWKVCYDAVAEKYATIFALLIYTLIKAISLNVRWKAENNKSVGGEHGISYAGQALRLRLGLGHGRRHRRGCELELALGQ